MESGGHGWTAAGTVGERRTADESGVGTVGERGAAEESGVGPVGDAGGRRAAGLLEMAAALLEIAAGGGVGSVGDAGPRRWAEDGGSEMAKAELVLPDPRRPSP